MVSLTAASALPYLITSIVLVPILSHFWLPFGSILNSTSVLYSIALFFNFVKHETDFQEKSDGFMYYWLACSGVIAIAVSVFGLLVS